MNQISFDLNPNQVSVIVDIGDTRVRLYIVSDGIKMYRRMPIRLTEKFKSSAKNLILFYPIFRPS